MTELVSRSTKFSSDQQAARVPDRGYRISVIVPVGPGDDSWKSLVPCFSLLQEEVEICLVATCPAPQELPLLLQRQGVDCKTQWIVSPPGRARQMNEGVRQTTGDFVWFLHADSHFSDAALARLFASLEMHPNALHYFDLVFDRKQIPWVLLNEWGVWFRSRVFQLPFGDQGLCLHRQLVAQLGPFDEAISYGEDHLLVWSCHRHGIPVRPLCAKLLTSPRKYHKQGWLRTTALHGWRTWRQAVPQFWRFVRSRFR